MAANGLSKGEERVRLRPVVDVVLGDEEEFIISPLSPEHRATDEPWSLTIEDMMRMTGKTRRWLFRHKHLPFIRVISRKTVIGDADLLHKWIAAQRAK
jgi:hypothetical protein